MWYIRSASGRASRTAHLLSEGGRARCGWSQVGGWSEAHANSVRCRRCERVESMSTARRLAAHEPAPDDLMDSWTDEWAGHA